MTLLTRAQADELEKAFQDNLNEDGSLNINLDCKSILEEVDKIMRNPTLNRDGDGCGCGSKK